MKSKRVPAVEIVVVSLAVSVLAVLGDGAISAQDTAQAKYRASAEWARVL